MITASAAVDAGGPSVTDWITAWTTAAAFLAWRQLRVLVRDKEAEQASKFAVWAEYSSPQHELQVLHHNASPVPVYNVRGTLAVGDRYVPFNRGTLGPTVAPVEHRVSTRVLAAEIYAELRERFGDNVQNRDVFDVEDLPAEVGLARAELAENVGVEITFSDAAGISWRRLPDGTLIKGPGSRRGRRWQWRRHHFEGNDPASLADDAVAPDAG